MAPAWLGFLVAAAPVVLLGVLAVAGADQRVAGAGEAATAAGAVLGPRSPLVGLSWPDVFAAHQIGLLDLLFASVGQQTVIDMARAVVLVMTVTTCLLLWPICRRMGLSPAAAALAVVVSGLPAPLVATLYGSVDAGALAATWLAVGAALFGRTWRTRSATAGLVLVAALTAPLAAVGLLAVAAQSALAAAVAQRSPKRAVLAAVAAVAAVGVAALSTGSGPWVTAGGGAVPTPLLAGILAVGAVVLALSWVAAPRRRPVVAGAAAVLCCAAVPGPHTTTALLVLVPALAVLIAALVDRAVARSPRSGWAVVVAVVLCCAVTSGQLLTVATAQDTDRTRLGTWVRSELGDTALAVDPLAAAQLVQDGVPIGNLVPAGSPAPPGTPTAVRTPPGSGMDDPRLLVAVPEGPGGGPVAVLRPEPDPDGAARRRLLGSALVGNRALTLTPAATDALRGGLVDVRLMTILAGLSATQRLTVEEFAAVADEPPAAPRRIALISEVDGAPAAAPGATGPVERWLAVQQPPYRPAAVVLEQGVLVVRYTVASPGLPG